MEPQNRHRLKSDSGSAAVEFALVMILLVILIVGMVSIGVLYQVQVSVTHAAREGARLASVNKFSEAVVRSRAGVPEPDKLTVRSDEVTGADGKPVSVKVTASYPITIRLAFFTDPVGLGSEIRPITLSSTAEMRVEYSDD